MSPTSSMKSVPLCASSSAPGEFQMVYVLKGWVKTYIEGQGETLMKEGSSWTQPPRVKHLIMDYSDDVELLEVILPADFKTVELAA
jgi:quercetin dioxygenase-like cupin family protein